jgi:hypothetical protein
MGQGEGGGGEVEAEKTAAALSQTVVFFFSSSSAHLRPTMFTTRPGLSLAVEEAPTVAPRGGEEAHREREREGESAEAGKWGRLAGRRAPAAADTSPPFGRRRAAHASTPRSFTHTRT